MAAGAPFLMVDCCGGGGGGGGGGGDGSGPGGGAQASPLFVSGTCARTALPFQDFVRERQRIAVARRVGGANPPWTAYRTLAEKRFCCIDRRDDFVTRELIRELRAEHRAGWAPARRVALCAALRFTSSRRGAAVELARLLDQDASSGGFGALERGLLTVQCGHKTYQMSMRRPEIAARIAAMAEAVEQRTAAAGGEE